MKFVPIPYTIIFPLLLACLCYVNLEYMHFTIVTDRTEFGIFPYVENICYTFIDICILFTPFFLFIKKRYFLFFIPYFVGTFFTIANIWYSRYFYNYMPPSLYTELNNLNGLSDNTFAAIRIQDTFLLLTSIIGLGYYWMFHKQFAITPLKLRIKVSAYTLGIVVLIVGSMILLSTRNWPTLESKFVTPYNYSTAESNFKFGIFHSTIVQTLQNKKATYSKEELEQLKPYFQGITNKIDAPKQNVIIIIVESLLSYATELCVGDKEITPNLNQLVKEEGYYNHNMTSCIRLGESSDGQFTYLTGLLPKQQGVTIIDYFNNTFHSIPFFLKEKLPMLHSRMTIPTSSKMWRQDAMCVKYNIDSLFSRKNYHSPGYNETWLDDKTLFEFAASKDLVENQPFFSVLLTLSTHTPYNKIYEPCDIEFPENYSEALKVYLSNVHYMDKYLGKYISTLKNKGLYDNTLIVITSDHTISKEWLHSENVEISSKIPLYIINSPVTIDKQSDYPITQADIFPTMLDLLGIETQWRGVGNSLLTPDSILLNTKELERNAKAQQISDIILNSDYLKYQ